MALFGPTICFYLMGYIINHVTATLRSAHAFRNQSGPIIIHITALYRPSPLSLSLSHSCSSIEINVTLELRLMASSIARGGEDEGEDEEVSLSISFYFNLYVFCSRIFFFFWLVFWEFLMHFVTFSLRLKRRRLMKP